MQWEPRVVNLTPHPIVVRLFDSVRGEEFDLVFPPSGRVARVKAESWPLGYLAPTPMGGVALVVRSSFGEIEGLPEPEEGTLFLVSALVAQAAAKAGRLDVLAPDTGPDSAIRNEDGQIVAVRRFVTFAEWGEPPHLLPL